MRGTLREGDCLRVLAVPFASLQAGDVVAFHSCGKVLAHRILLRNERELWTRGDNNLIRDTVAVTPENLMGRVVARERNGKSVPVSGGSRGWRRAVVLRAGLLLRRVLEIPYRWIRASQIVPLFWRPSIHRARFSRSGESLSKCIHRGRTIGVWNPSEGCWVCRKPYDLLFPVPPQ